MLVKNSTSDCKIKGLNPVTTQQWYKITELFDLLVGANMSIKHPTSDHTVKGLSHVATRNGVKQQSDMVYWLMVATLLVKHSTSDEMVNDLSHITTR